MVLHPNQREDLKVFISTRESTCDECGENLGSKAWITLARRYGADPARAEAFDAVCGGVEMEPHPETV